MEPENTTNTNNNNSNKMVFPLVLVAIVAIAAIVFYTTSMSSKSQTTNTSVQTSPAAQQATSAPVQEQDAMAPAASSSYKDGTYSATGNYVSPGGAREIEVSITIADGKITDSTFVGKAEDPQSKRFQGEFSQGYKAMIVGKNIDEVELTKVSGSSLTPQGFNDALTKIKTEAAS